MRFALATGTALILASTVTNVASAAVTFQKLGDALGTNSPGGMATGVSGDGSTTVGWDILPTAQSGGTYGKLPAKWTPTNVLTEVPGSTVGGQAYAASFNGSVIVGSRNLSNGLSDYRAFRWTASTGMVSLGVPSGLTDGSAFATSSDGAVTVGNSYNRPSGGNSQATRWDSTGTASLLGGGAMSTNGSTAYGVSGDGTVIIGNAVNSAALSQPFRWTASTGMQSMTALTPTSGVSWGTAAAISTDASTVVGNAGSVIAGNPFNGTDTAYRWTLATGFVNLGFGTPDAVSADGTIIGGKGTRGVANPGSSAAFWTASGQQVNLADLLTANGIDLTGWTSLENIYGVSSDGTVLVGSGFYAGHQAAWIATIPEPASVTSIVGVMALLLARRRHSSRHYRF